MRHILAVCLRPCAVLGALLTFAISTSAFAQADPLQQGFSDPPASAKPRVWWHWMNGNITQEGIRLDLDWMKRIGIGGFQNFDAELGVPQVVEKRLAYMSPEWGAAFRFTTDLAEQNGLEMAIAASPGWSETGGPWVKPEQAMKKLVWSETDVTGGRRFSGKLAPPPINTGPFQDAAPAPEFGSAPDPSRKVPQFYADSAVIAYRLRNAETAERSRSVTVSAGAAPIDSNLLSDGKLDAAVALKIGSDGVPPCVAFDYGKPTRVASLVLAMPVGGDFFKAALFDPVLESSDDGANYRKVTDVPAGGFIQHTVSFAPVMARYFRVCFRAPPPPFTDLLDGAAPGANMAFPFGGGGPPASFDLYELRLLATPRVNRSEEKAGFAFVPDYYAIAGTAVDAADVVPAVDIVDLTSRVKPDGALDWNPPAGRWKVLRFGYSLTGKENHPATHEATGLEVDKLDRRHVKAYLDTYLANYERVLGPERMGAKGVRALLVDSIEVGAQNWTESLPAEFKARRGYDLVPWMPALTGVIIGSVADSDRFLYDFRRTIAELLSDSHYAQIAESAKARGLIQYGEALEQGRPVLGDDMEMRRHTNVPMAAMWTYSLKTGTPPPARFVDIRGAASVAHIYGQNLVAAESLTSAFAPWAFSPRDLKPMIDLEFVLGVNRPVIHTSVHQPLVDKAPGLTLAIFGQYFNRNESWAEQAGPWVSYLARTSYLLQQGHFAADVAYFYGEEAPLTALYANAVTPDAPKGYGFDFANVDVLLNRLKVDDGALVTDTGMRYRLLYLGGTSSRMTLPVLRRIQALVAQGATVVGPRPTASPSLADDPAEFAKVADTLWSGTREAGKGRVIASTDVNAVLESLGVARDFDYRPPQADSEVTFLHRRLDRGEVYFLTNRKAREETVEANFRVTGLRPEIWRAQTGKSEPVSYRIENGRTFVSLTFAPYDAFFVVFRAPAGQQQVGVARAVSTPVETLDQGWTVAFQPRRGGPAAPRKMAAGSWSTDADPSIRYFSGTATYTRTLSVPSHPAIEGLSKDRLILDLGDVRELVEVRINDASLGVLWNPPYRIDVTDAIRAGKNRLELRVTNLWVNRLIGDAQPGAQKITFTVGPPPYQADAPLRPSGLLGPVTLSRAQLR